MAHKFLERSSRIDSICLLAGVIFFIAVPFHEGVIDREKSFIILRVRWAIVVVELVAVKAHARHLEKHASIQLIVYRIKTFEHLFGHSVWVIGIQVFFFGLFGVFVCDDIFVAVFYGKALSRQEVHFVEQSWNAVHLNYVLDVLFCA